MQAQLEVLDGLVRRLDISVPMTQIETEVNSRLKRLARDVRMHGFRPGKAPFSVVARQHGSSVRQEVLGETLQSRFGEAVQSHSLRIAGYPRFEQKLTETDSSDLHFSANFEVYPEVVVGDLTGVKLSRPKVDLSEADVDKTLEVLRKQRRGFAPAERAAAEGDLVKFDYKGTIDGEAFDGGAADDFTAVIGESRLLKDFEKNLVGLKAGDAASFDLAFPADYAAAHLAGKAAHFDVKMKEVQAPQLPELGAEFARTLGVEDGDIEKLKAEIKTNLEREVTRRVRARMKEQTLDVLAEKTTLILPQSLVAMEISRLRQATEADMQERGVQTMKLTDDMFTGQAERRVRLGLILAEIVQKNELRADADRVRTLIEEQAQSYEEPAEVVQWYYQSPERMQEIESLALEESVVAWFSSQVEVEDTVVTFDELMGRA
jgi:trigger factor